MKQLLLLLLMLSGNGLFSQEVVTGPDGKKIILYADGTWEPYGQDGEREVFTPDSVELERNLFEFNSAKQAERQLSLQLIQKRLEVTELKGKVEDLESKAGVAEQMVADFRNKLKIARSRERELEVQLQEAKQWSQLMERLVYLSKGFRDKEISLWKKENQSKKMESESIASQTKSYLNYSPSKDVTINPPEKECEFIFSGVDSKVGKRRQDIHPEIIFSYTDPGLEGHFKKQDLITGRVNLTSFSAGREVLNLEVSIASKQAAKMFGSISPNDYIRIKTLDGQDIVMVNQNSDKGRWDERRQAHIYRLQYPIGAKEQRLLSNSEIDKVEVRWSNVKEEYEVLDVDVLIRQFACLHGN